jgi:hypothetical protein
MEKRVFEKENWKLKRILDCVDFGVCAVNLNEIMSSNEMEKKLFNFANKTKNTKQTFFHLQQIQGTNLKRPLNNCPRFFCFHFICLCYLQCTLSKHISIKVLVILKY